MSCCASARSLREPTVGRGMQRNQFMAVHQLGGESLITEPMGDVVALPTLTKVY